MARYARLLNTKQVAERLGLHEDTVEEKLRAGVIPGYRLGVLWRVDEGELDRWIASKRYTRDDSTTRAAQVAA